MSGSRSSRRSGRRAARRYRARGTGSTCSGVSRARSSTPAQRAARAPAPRRRTTTAGVAALLSGARGLARRAHVSAQLLGRCPHASLRCRIRPSLAAHAHQPMRSAGITSLHVSFAMPLCLPPAPAAHWPWTVHRTQRSNNRASMVDGERGALARRVMVRPCEEMCGSREADAQDSTTTGTPPGARPMLVLALVSGAAMPEGIPEDCNLNVRVRVTANGYEGHHDYSIRVDMPAAPESRWPSTSRAAAGSTRTRRPLGSHAPSRAARSHGTLHVKLSNTSIPAW